MANPKRITLEELAGSLKKDFNKIHDRLDGVDKRLDGIDDRLYGIDGRLDKIDSRLDTHGKRLDSLDRSYADLASNQRRLVDTLTTKRVITPEEARSIDPSRAARP